MPVFTGTSANEIFTGGPEMDIIVGASGADTLSGGGGDDFIFSATAPPPSTFSSWPGVYKSFLDTGSEVDVLSGGDGWDRIFAGYGDFVDGGTSTSPNSLVADYLYVSFQGAPSGVTFDFRLSTQTIGGGVITNMESLSYVQGSRFADNINASGQTGISSDFTLLEGMEGDDTVTAGYYTGLIYGGEGNDVLDGRPSQYLSSIEGGDGNDTIYARTSGSATTLGGAGDDTISGGGLIHGGLGNDRILIESSYGPAVYGDEGDDVIVAGNTSSPTSVATPVVVSGGAGADNITGGGGDDVLASGDFVSGASFPADDMGLERDSISGGPAVTP